MSQFKNGQTVTVINPSHVDYGRSFTIDYSDQFGVTGFICGEGTGANHDDIASYNSSQAKKARKTRNVQT